VAYVVPADGTAPDEDRLLEELRHAVREALADYKAPDRVVVVSSLPLTSMMKVDKRCLADRAARLPVLRPGGSRSAPPGRPPTKGVHTP
jgi:acyl-coenzyme A synthetase/AMP-(fatty) acid ligase